MKLMGVAFYEDGKFVKFIPVDDNGKMAESFTVFPGDDGTVAYAMFATDGVILPSNTTVEWAGTPSMKGRLYNE